MFTGIVEEVGAVQEITPGHLTVEASAVMGDLKVSDSICVNGTCLTVTVMTAEGFSVDTVPETLRRTNLGELSAGDIVNLERPMKADGRFGGHIVQGHVDGTGTVESIEPDGEARMVRFSAESSIMRYVVEKGFVTVDGASLTVVNCSSRTFSVTIIPFTWEHTVFKARKVGDTVNLEADVIAKYVERLATGPRLPVDLADEL
ncbi:MAG: riboflavin synthase [Chloroflexi bacterium]|nr:riboflavin synthase [Chloroflexota bacterium]